MVPGNATMPGIGNSATSIKNLPIRDCTRKYAGNKSLDQLPVRWACRRLYLLARVSEYRTAATRMTTKTGSGPLLRVRPLEFIGGIEDQSLVVFLYANIHVSLAVEESEAYFPLFVYSPGTLNLMAFGIGSASSKV